MDLNISWGDKSQKPDAASLPQFDLPDQQAILTMLISDPAAFQTCRHAIDPKYFHDTLQVAVRFILAYEKMYALLPSVEQIEAKAGIRLEKFSEPGMHTAALVNDVEAFCRYKAMEYAVLSGLGHLEAGAMEKIAEETTAALNLRITEDKDLFEGFWIDEIANIVPPTYLIKPWLVRDTVTCMYGEPGSFKSFLCLEAAFRLATGTQFNGHPVEKTCVAYIAAEGQSGVKLRFAAMCEKHCITPDRTSIRIISQPVNLLDSESVGRLIAELQRQEKKENIKFGVMFLDTYSQCIAGADENSASVASAASASMIRIRRELGVTVVYVHHTGKDRSRGMRGSDALRANTDGAIEIVRTSETGMSATATVKRHKDAATGASFDFTMAVQPISSQAGRDIDSSLVVEFCGVEPAMYGQSMITRMTDQKTLRDLLNVMQTGEELSVGKAARKIGMYDNPSYKTKLSGLLPLNEPVEVQDKLGLHVGTLVRHPNPKKGTADVYGVIVCVEKVLPASGLANSAAVDSQPDRAQIN